MEHEKMQITIPVSNDRLTKLDRIAIGIDRDRAHVVEEAIDAYLAAEGGDLLDGFAALDAGKGVDADETIRKARAIVARARAKRSTSR